MTWNNLLVQLIPSPSNPVLHVHAKLQITSAQVAFTWQLSVSNSLSSISVQRRMNNHSFLTERNTLCMYVHHSICLSMSVTCHKPCSSALLVQLTPFPSKPISQVHSKLPNMLLQVAFTWQSTIPVIHSSISIRNIGTRI